ncbi:MAG: PEP-CTERM sorting domain-containing protein [Phycisphaerales bacterium]
MKKVFGLVAFAALAGTAMASTVTPGTSIGSVTFTGVSGAAAIGNAGNSTGSWVATGSGTVGSIEVTGSLTEVNTGTFASEARVNIVNSANANAGVVRAASSSGWTGTLAVGPTTVGFFSGGPISVTAGDTLNFEWFESFDDGSDGLIDSTWDTVTYNFMTAATINNGGAALGAVTGVTSYSGGHVAGGLDFFTFSVPAIVNPGDSFSIAMSAGLIGTSMTDTEIALYDSLGNKVAENDDAVGLFSGLDYDDLTPLAGGSYTLVTGGFNSVFPATLAGAFTAGTNAGSYELTLTYVPAPSALALLGLGGIVAGRRRR